MEKSIYSDAYRILLQQLKAAREAKVLTQVEIAERLGQTQSFVSKVERGERRLDVVELRAFCQAMEVEFTPFLNELDKSLGQFSNASKTL